MFKKIFYLKGVIVVIVALKGLKLSSTMACASTAKPFRNSCIPIMEVLFKGRTLLCSFPPQPAFARREETLTSGLWWVNVRLHLASKSQKCFLCCFLVNGICSVKTMAVWCSFYSKICILVTRQILLGFSEWEHPPVNIYVHLFQLISVHD